MATRRRRTRFGEDSELDALSQAYLGASEKLYRLSVDRKLRGDEDAPEAIAFKAAMLCIDRGIICPDWAADAISEKWEKFERFEIASLSKAFKIPDHKQMRARRDRTMMAILYGRVRELQKEFPLKDNKDGKGALTRAGEEFNIGGKKVEQLMKAWKDLCKRSGSDPDANEKSVGDAAARIYLTVAEAIAPRKKS